MNLNLSIGNFFYPVPSSSPRTLCEKKLSPDSFSSLKWRILQNSCFSPRKKYFKIRYWIIHIFFLLIACSYRSHRRCLELIRRPCASRKVRAKLALEISTYLLKFFRSFESRIQQLFWYVWRTSSKFGQRLPVMKNQRRNLPKLEMDKGFKLIIFKVYCLSWCFSWQVSVTTYNLSICPETGLSSQQYKCAECRKQIGLTSEYEQLTG